MWCHDQKRRAGSKDRKGAQPPNTAGGNTTRGEPAHGETHPPTLGKGYNSDQVCHRIAMAEALSRPLSESAAHTESTHIARACYAKHAEEELQL